jgi:hypothetical protein
MTMHKWVVGKFACIQPVKAIYVSGGPRSVFILAQKKPIHMNQHLSCMYSYTSSSAPDPKDNSFAMHSA